MHDHHRLVPWIFAATLAALAACSSPRGSTSAPQAGDTTADSSATATKGDPLRMTVTQFQNGAVFELVNRSHSDPVEQYSTVRSDASRKVQDDKLMAALRDGLRDNGYDKLAHSGRAPALATGTRAWTLEIESKDGTSYILATPETPADTLKKMRELRDAVIEVYNRTQGWQSVEIKDGKLPFQQTQIGEKKKP